MRRRAVQLRWRAATMTRAGRSSRGQRVVQLGRPGAERRRRGRLRVLLQCGLFTPAHAQCSRPCTMFMSMYNVHVHVQCSCPCTMFMPMHNVHVHVQCSQRLKQIYCSLQDHRREKSKGWLAICNFVKDVRDLKSLTAIAKTDDGLHVATSMFAAYSGRSGRVRMIIEFPTHIMWSAIHFSYRHKWFSKFTNCDN